MKPSGIRRSNVSYVSGGPYVTHNSQQHSTVHSDLRGRGIGTRLVKEALSAVAEHPRAEWVHVDASEELMKRFYFPAGFRPTPAGVVWVQDIRDGKVESVLA